MYTGVGGLARFHRLMGIEYFEEFFPLTKKGPSLGITYLWVSGMGPR